MGFTRVPPGNETGVYYLIVSNLPWECPWQKLKDFARNQQPGIRAIEIDHCHVYPPTGGWIRVRGKENFLQAKDNLARILDGRALVVEAKNDTESVSIKDDEEESARNALNSWAPIQRSYAHQQHSSVSTYSGIEGWPGGSGTALASPTLPTTSYYCPSPQMLDNYAQQQRFPATSSYQEPVPAGLLYTNVVMASPVYVAQMLPASDYTYSSSVNYFDQTHSVPSATRRQEAREIVVTQLPSSTTDSDLQRLLIKCIVRALPKHSTHPPCDLLESAEIILHSDGRPKGHAFVIVKTEQLAQSLVRKLDNLRFQNRTLKAHLTKEGVAAPIPRLKSPSRGSSYDDSGSLETTIAQVHQLTLGEYPQETASTAQPSFELSHSVESSSDRMASSTTRSGSSSARKSNGGSSDRRKSTSPAVVNGSSSTSGHGRDEKNKKRRS